MKSLLLLVALTASAFAGESYLKANMAGKEMQEKGLLLEYLKLGQ